MEDHQQSHHHLRQPLILHGNHPTTTTPPSKNNQFHDHSGINILVRFISVIFIGLLALYANHEASKGFDITIVNDVKASAAGRRFHLFYVSNDKATRIILHTSNFVEHLLYPNNHPIAAHPKKHINRVVLRLSNNFTSYSPNKQNIDHFVLHISPSIMDEPDTHHALVTAIRRGMTRVWLFDGGARAPPELIDGMVEYVKIAAEGGGGWLLFGHHLKNYGNIGIDKLAECDKLWWKGKEPLVVALLLNYYEGKSKGFIQRLNGAMKEKWDDRMVDDALGTPLQNLCGVYNFSTLLGI